MITLHPHLTVLTYDLPTLTIDEAAHTVENVVTPIYQVDALACLPGQIGPLRWPLQF